MQLRYKPVPSPFMIVVDSRDSDVIIRVTLYDCYAQSKLPSWHKE